MTTVKKSPILDESLLRGPAAAGYLRMSNVSFQQLVKAGTLPQPVRLQPHRPLWRTADLDRALASL